MRSLIGTLGVTPTDGYKLLQDPPIDHQGIGAGRQIGETNPGLKLNV